MHAKKSNELKNNTIKSFFCFKNSWMLKKMLLQKSESIWKSLYFKDMSIYEKYVF